MVRRFCLRGTIPKRGVAPFSLTIFTLPESLTDKPSHRGLTMNAQVK